MRTPQLEPRRPARRLIGVAAVATATLAITGLTVPAAYAATPTHSIADVQGSAATTPIAGQTVTVEGIVTADYRGVSGYRGIVVQSEGADVTPGVSDALFVFLGSKNPAGIAIGDKVTVTGTAGENFDQTQINASGATGVVELVAAGVGVPAATPLPDSVVGSDREPYENMLVSPTGDYRVISSHNLFSFGELWLDPGELPVKSTETTDAGPDANAIAAANRASRILLDDGYSIRVDNAQHPGTQPYFTADTVVRNGDRVDFPEAGYILAWGFNEWRLQPTTPINDASPASAKPTFEMLNPRPEAAPEVGGDFSVAAFNVFNYFTTLTSQNSQARGADTAADFAIQKSKIIAAINGLDADVVALQEIENSVKLGETVDEALADLVAGLNAAAGAGTWDYVRTPAALQDAAITDFITNAIIFKPAAVTPSGASLTQVDETVWDIAREPLAQAFTANSSGKVFSVVANHFKSKGGGTGAEPADGQGFFNAERVEQANSLLAFVNDTVIPASGSEDVFLIGDFNAYAEEDPAQVFTSAGYVDLVPAKTDGQYTYTFDGELGSLDHVFASASVAASVTGVGVWNINSPEWGDRGYEFDAAEAGTVFRSSDHDPIKVGVSAEVAPVEIEILTVNDFHGRLEFVAGNPPIPGAAQMGGMVDFWEAQNPNTTFVGAGDMIGASTFTSFIQNDRPTIDALNAMGFDGSSFGNHEFDQGRADVDDRILDAADWPYVAANLYDRATGAPAYDEYFLQEFQGVSVGFIGAVTEALPELVSPAGIATLEVRSIIDEVNRVADYLSDGNAANGEADVLVLLVHEGAATPAIESSTDDSAFGQIVMGIDPEISAIVSGHTHLAYDHEVTVPGMDRPRLVLSAGQYGSFYGHMDLTVDPITKELVSFTAEVLPLSGFTPDAEVAAIVADAVAVAKELGSVKVGEITDNFYRAVQNPTATNPFPENRGGESTLGNFVADVQLWAAQELGAQIALMNPGGLRADLVYASSGPSDPDGNVTYAEAANVQPFANTLTTLTLTGAQLKQVFEEQWQPAGAQRPFLKLAVSEGLEYTYDPTSPVGSRITAIYLNGELVEAADTFTVVANSFLAAGGDNFFTLAEGTNRADSGRIDLQSMVDYFKANPVATPSFEQRAVGVHVSAPDADGYSAGDQVTLDLSSLLLSRGGPTTGTVEVLAGSTVLGSATIDGTIVDTTDEQGRAQVQVTIPADAAEGTLVLTIRVVETGTSIDVPLQIVSNLEEIANTKAPKITGDARVGKTLKVNEGNWSVEKPKFGYQWLRDGQPIDGATGESYKLTQADAGHQISVEVTASASGFAPGTATTKKVEVNAPVGIFGWLFS
ncbi:ExeM/NucH family extracellular endonuclease [Diaminobutyricimonas sp. LJ205]|uniref:ExeM/NucH family extracellular endonuclease n=1 Tax=Diaminobutyricimonas sp. LJ205 TaxID=2683590 RepID=UPI0012F4E084|nr:ExeM/NucH family extracellular endonuclease [Diaminobutyricimonas sp. LJ205]